MGKIKPNGADFRLMAAAGFTLIPLHPFDAMVSVKGKMKQAGKRPLDAKWTKKPYDSAQVVAEAETTGRNLGVRLDAGHLVVDVVMDASLTYAAIVEAILKQFPDAKTTARSVASVAARLRKTGVDVPHRRTSKGEAEA